MATTTTTTTTTTQAEPWVADYHDAFSLQQLPEARGEESTSIRPRQPLPPKQHVPEHEDHDRSHAHGNGTIPPSRLQKTAIVLQLSGMNLCSSAINGLVVVGLPVITADLSLPPSLAFWPTSATSLGTAATLLLAGSFSDALGARVVDLVGCAIIAAFMVGGAAATTGSQLVAMRALQGVGGAMHYASSVAIVTQAFPRGKGRNIAFACLGLSQPLGFSFGLVIGGVLIDATGWRTAWYIYAGICCALFCVGVWALPPNPDKSSFRERLTRCRVKVDWVGALLASAFMAILCYLLAILSADMNRIHSGETIALLCVTVLLLPCFLGWMHRQTSLGRPALIPLSLWRNPAFTSICAITALAFSAVNAMELFCNLFFQEIQNLSPLESSIRILPSLVVAVLLGFGCGLLVDRFRAMWLISISSVISAVSPLLMALVKPEWSYWKGAFEAQLLCHVAANTLFTVGLSIISEVFPEDTQALAGAVFNTSSQFGTALGLSVLQMISASVTASAGSEAKEGAKDALLQGYRASFWALMGFLLACALISCLGLRRVGRIGLKLD